MKTATDRLTDPREQSLDQADELLVTIFDSRLDILRAETAAEKQISEIREQLALNTAQDRQRLQLAEARLSAYILAHRDQFKRPRMRKIPWGSYGLRTSTRLAIADEAELIQWARDHAHGDWVVTTERLQKGCVTEALRAGADIPGATLDTAEASEYKLDPAALEAEL